MLLISLFGIKNLIKKTVFEFITPQLYIKVFIVLQYEITNNPKREGAFGKKLFE
jgi:hypothetical protein